MELKEFIANFADQFDDTDPSEIKADTNFRDLEEWSSLTGLSIIAMVDEEYEVALRGEDLRNAQTVEDLYKIIKNRL